MPPIKTGTPAENRRFQLECQLHEQYAVNNNAKVSSFVTFTIALFALFGFFGYIFAYTVSDFSNSGEFFIVKGDKVIFTLEVFYLSSLIVSGILFFLSVLSVSLGYSQRRDHLICYNIRRKYYGTDNYKSIFGKGYCPIKKTCKDFLPDYFNVFYWLFFVAQAFVIVSSFVKLATNLNRELSWSSWGLLVIIVLCLQAVMLVLTGCSRFRYFHKYYKLQKQFKD